MHADRTRFAPVRAALVALALLLVSPAALAQAQPKQAKPGQSKKIAAAQNHYKRASAFQDLREYDKAAAEYLKAYELYPHPDFLFNVAQVHREAGNKRKAIEYFDRYLERAPEGRGAADAKRMRAALAAELAADKADEPAGPPVQEDRGDAGDTSDSGDRAGESDVEETNIDDIERERDDAVDHRPRTLKLSGLAAAGVGVIALGVGVKLSLDVSRINSELEEQFDADKERDGKNAERNSKISYAVGGVAVAAGAALYYWGWRTGKRNDRVTVAPALLDRGTALVVSGRF